MMMRSLVPLTALALAATSLPAQQDTTTPPAPAPAPLPAPAPATVPKAPKSSSTQITYEDIEKMRPNVISAYEVVQRLRPRWLQAPRQSTLPGSASRQMVLRVYLDDQDMGGAEFLRTIPADQIYTLRYMTTTEIGARFGPSSGPGIVVTLQR